MKRKHLPHSWLLVLSLAMFSLGMIGGFLRSADSVAADFVYSAPAHLPGRVAGATVNVKTGPVQLVTNGKSGQTVFSIKTGDEPVSLFNLLRLAEKTTTLRVGQSAPVNAQAVITSVNGELAQAPAVWEALHDDGVVQNFDVANIFPGDTVELKMQ